MGRDSYCSRKFTVLKGKDGKVNRGSGPRSNRKTRGRLETRMPAILKAYTYTRQPIPCKSFKKAHQIPVNPSSLHCLLPLVSGPQKMGHTFVVVGKSQRQHLAGTWREKGRTKHYWASLHTKTSPYNADWTNLSLAVWPPTIEMQLPDVNQSWLEPDLILGREKLPQEPHVFILPAA